MKTRILKTGRNLFLVTVLIPISVLVNAQARLAKRLEDPEFAHEPYNLIKLDSGCQKCLRLG